MKNYLINVGSRLVPLFHCVQVSFTSKDVVAALWLSIQSIYRSCEILVLWKQANSSWNSATMHSNEPSTIFLSNLYQFFFLQQQPPISSQSCFQSSLHQQRLVTSSWEHKLTLTFIYQHARITVYNMKVWNLQTALWTVFAFMHMGDSTQSSTYGVYIPVYLNHLFN